MSYLDVYACFAISAVLSIFAETIKRNTMIRLRLKEIMEEKGMTAKEVAKKYGAKERSITNLMNNWSGCYPSMMTIARLAKILGCRIIELIDEDGFYYDASREKRITRMLKHGTKREYTCPYCGGVFDIREVPKKRNTFEDEDDGGIDINLDNLDGL